MFGRKKANLFGNEIEPDCAYCAYISGKACSLGSEKRPCGRFLYDPLKRAPKSLPALKQHNPEEFKL